MGLGLHELLALSSAPASVAPGGEPFGDDFTRTPDTPVYLSTSDPRSGETAFVWDGVEITSLGEEDLNDLLVDFAGGLGGPKYTKASTNVNTQMWYFTPPLNSQHHRVTFRVGQLGSITGVGPAIRVPDQAGVPAATASALIAWPQNAGAIRCGSVTQQNLGQVDAVAGDEIYLEANGLDGVLRNVTQATEVVFTMSANANVGTRGGWGINSRYSRVAWCDWARWESF